MSLQDDIFYYDKSNFEECSEPWTSTSFKFSNFDKELRRKWDQAQDDGHFRYKLDIEETKVFGDNKYIAQLNVKRATERRKPDAIMSVSQPFTPASFNFTKIKKEEILFELVERCEPNEYLTNGYEDGGSTAENMDDVDGLNAERNCEKQKARNLVVINVSPLEYGHILLIPDIDACRPQILTQEAIKLSLEILLLSKHRGFRVGFNSLCALASVNHQHLHAYYLDKELYAEYAPVEHISGCLYEFVALPTKGFAVQLHGSTVEKLSSMLSQIADYCVSHEIAHNLYMTRGPVFGEPRHSLHRTIRVYFWARRKVIGVKDEAAFNVALVELAGHLPIKSETEEAAFNVFNVALVELAGHVPIKIKELFGDLDEEQIETTIRGTALEDTEYHRIKQDVIKICDKYS